MTVPGSSGPCSVSTVSVAPSVVMMWVAAAGAVEVVGVDLARPPRSAATRGPPTTSSTGPAASAGYWLRMNEMSMSDSAVFHPIEKVPIVSASGTAYCMIEVGSNVVKLVVSAS